MPRKRDPRKVRCKCQRCGVVKWLLPDEVGAMHYTDTKGYCSPRGDCRFMPKAAENTREVTTR